MSLMNFGLSRYLGQLIKLPYFGADKASMSHNKRQFENRSNKTLAKKEAGNLVLDV